MIPILKRFAEIRTRSTSRIFGFRSKNLSNFSGGSRQQRFGNTNCFVFWPNHSRYRLCRFVCSLSLKSFFAQLILCDFCAGGAKEPFLGFHWAVCVDLASWASNGWAEFELCIFRSQGFFRWNFSGIFLSSDEIRAKFFHFSVNRNHPISSTLWRIMVPKEVKRM